MWHLDQQAGSVLGMCKYYSCEQEASFNSRNARCGSWKSTDLLSVEWSLGHRVGVGIFTNIMLF